MDENTIIIGDNIEVTTDDLAVAMADFMMATLSA